jgi:hypothetical protein
MELMKKSLMTKGILTCTSSEGRFGAVECNVFPSYKVLPPITPLVAREIQRGAFLLAHRDRTQSNDEFQDLRLVSSKEAASYE